MNQRLSTCLLFGALLSLPLATRGQETNSTIARRITLNGPSFQTEDQAEISRETSPSVSARELSIPERAVNSYKKGMDRLSKNDPAGSLLHFQRAASESPNFYEAYHAIGLVQLRLGHEEEARQAFQKSIDASGGHYAEPHFGLSAILCNQQQFAEAEPIIRKAVELAPGFNPGHFILAWALFGLNRLDEAEKVAHEASIRDPKLAAAYLLLAQIYIRRSDYSEELVELDAYLRLEPEGPLSDQARVAQEYAKRKLAGSVVIIEAAQAKP
jgi:tetratricopeptide (TPR) repeat protein